MREYKYSKGFERDFKFYQHNMDRLTFSGQYKPVASYAENGPDAKRAFFIYDSQGVLKPTKEPELLSKLISCKKSVNFHIKQWAAGYSEGTLLLLDLCDIQRDFKAPQWVIKAIKHQGKRTPETLI